MIPYKKTAFLAIILILSMLCSSCKGNDKINNVSIDSDVYSSSLGGLTPDNDTDHDTLITRTYSKEELFQAINLSPVTDEWYESASFNYTLKILNQEFPIECLRKKDNYVYYAVYKTTEKGTLYLFFKYLGGRFAFTHCIYWNPNIDTSNYKSGTDINFSDAQKNDEVLKGITDDFLIGANMTRLSENKFTTLHPTKDGLIQIEYQLKNGTLDDGSEELLNAKYKVKVKNTNNFKFKVISYGSDHKTQEFDCSLLDIDMRKHH